MNSQASFKVYSCFPENFNMGSVSERIEPLKVLMCMPDFFDIVDVKNIHMEGNANKLNKKLAVEQWENLKKIYLELKEVGIVEEVLTIEGVEDCEDMVFCANQTFPWVTEHGEKLVLMSKMRHESRQKEVPYFESYFEKLNYQPVHLKQTKMFEGMGDTIPHPGKRLLYGGYGHRSDLSAYTELSQQLKVSVFALELINPNFYHLDTCFVPLSDDSVMLCKEAFTHEGLALIQKCFKQLYFIPEREAIDTFCLNVHVIDNIEKQKKAAIIQKGSDFALKALKGSGYTVYEIETGEFMKSGGSVFCMKMMVY